MIDGPVFKGGLMSFGGTRSGQLNLTADTLEWRDSEDQSKAIDLSVIAIKPITARCRVRSSGDFSYEAESDLAKGSNFASEDARRRCGGTNAIVLLLPGIESQCPDTQVTSKVMGH